MATQKEIAVQQDDWEQDPRHDAVGEVLDRLVANDITARGVLPGLYEAACVGEGTTSLTMAAARALSARAEEGRAVLICTGWPSRSWLMEGLTETDGPAGAAYLARFLEQTLGLVPILVVAPGLESFAEAALRGAGLILADVDTALRSKSGAHRAAVAAVQPLTTDPERALAEAEELLDRLDPAAIIAIEMPGANADGEYHNVTARLVPSSLVAKADALVRSATARDILTVGIGDGGNELGMGNIAEAVRRLLPHGDRISPATTVDHLVVGSVSNFGALGVGAALAALHGRPELLRTVDLQRITDRLADAGAIDGLTAYVTANNDGLPPVGTRALVELVATAVEMHLGGWNKG
ncbi:hypothetical protein J2Y69_000817 [Microbacterium resistens]|uniref:D-glutamate cyclase-like C-terminal domain-containing protein n=1 Tax=Microbacterium resistens TaxID=156977 RepID=A0ABU1S9F1_9MICO|nr:glutamate cyclase domain-containing protein [Microbacterium resistens]MDR6866225.1 hypothetical protein [Microbacterium resistens]